MSASHEKASWFDTWWPLFLVAFGITFVLFLATFATGWGTF